MMSRMLRPESLTMASLGAAAVLYLGYSFVVLGLDSRDAGQYETVLASATAGQLERGPGSLYGPFTGSNPSVLMHAPAYYRVVGMIAMIPSRLGLDPLNASLATGRLVTILATLALLAAVWRLARLDGASARAGVLAVAIVASSPILGVLAIMVRADTLGVALATWGSVIVLEVLRDGSAQKPGRKLAIASVLFALAVSVKQLNVFVPTVSMLLLGLGWFRGRLPLAPIVGAIGLSTALGAAWLIGENVLTGGLMKQTVFDLPGGPFRAINYGGWGHVSQILTDCLRRSAGLLALGGIGLILARPWKRPPRLDAVLLVSLLVEVVVLVPLCLFNQGAADNYALQAVVVAATLTGRWLDTAFRTGQTPSRRLARALLVLAATGLLANDARLIRHSWTCRQDEARLIAAMLKDPRIADSRRSERYFVGNQSLNRLYGCRALIHDEWLYGAFETINYAEPRDLWLRKAITAGSVRHVIVPGEQAWVPGVEEPLSSLGYRRVGTHGTYAVWSRPTREVALETTRGTRPLRNLQGDAQPAL